MRIKNHVLESAKSMASSFVTTYSEIELCYGFALYLQWTAGTAPTGTFQVQGTVFPPEIENGRTRSDAIGSTDWVNVGTSVPAGGAAGTSLVNYDAQYYHSMRVVYTATTNSATAYIRVYKKGPG